MEHFFNRKPTKGYIELRKELEKGKSQRFCDDEVTVPDFVSKAACYVEDAIQGRLANGKGKMSTKSRKIQLCFFIQTHDWWNKFIYLSIIFMSILIFFEPPSSAAITVCHHGLFNYQQEGSICKDKEIIKDWEAWTIFVEFLLIMIFITDVFMKATYMKPSVYFTKKWHKVSGFFMLLFSIDWIIFTCTYYAIDVKGLRFSRPFRPILLLTRYRELRRILETLTDMLQKLLQLTFVILIFVWIFAWMAVTLFGRVYLFTDQCNIKNIRDNITIDCVKEPCWDTNEFAFCICNGGNETQGTGCYDQDAQFGPKYLPDDMQYFNETFATPFRGLVKLIVLISTENYPQIMLPAYKINPWTMLYFVLFIFIGMFLLLSVLLAVIVEFWLSYLKKTNDTEKRKERLGITKAFTWIDKSRAGYIEETAWNELILLLKKDFTKLQSHFMFQMLDYEQKGQLDVLDFLNITEALKMHYTLKDADTAIENTEIGQFARRILSYYLTVKGYEFTVQTLSFVCTLLHTILSVIHWVDVPNDYIIVHTAINTVLLLILLSEVLLRVMASGSGFFHPLINKWEVGSITLAFISMVGYWITWLSSLKEADSATVPFLPRTYEFFRLVWELMIFVRLAWLKNSLKGQLIFFYKVLMVLFELFLFIVIIMYVFLGVGLEFFAIATNDNNEENYFQHYTCKLGFITPWCGCLTLWQLITTSNWHEVMNSVHSASGWWAYIYFILFYIAIDLILLDLMIAIAIEMYNAVRQQSETEEEEGLFGDLQGICFEVYEGQDNTEAKQPTGQGIQRRRSRMNSIFTVNGSSPVEPYRKLILEVTRSKKGSWRQSIVSSEMFYIDSPELDAIQNSLLKDYGANSLDQELRVTEVKILYEEKKYERQKLTKPECKIYVEADIMNFKKPTQKQGNILMEINDNTSCLSFKVFVKTSSAPKEAVFRYSDEVQCENYFTLTGNQFEQDPESKQWKTTQMWRMKRTQKSHLLQEQISFYLSTMDNPHGECCAKITGIMQAKEDWENHKKVTMQNADHFSKISPLLKWFAHRVQTKQLVDDDSDDEKDDEKDMEGNKIGKHTGVKKKVVNRRVYIPNEYSKEKKYLCEAQKKYCEELSKAVPTSNIDVMRQVANFANFVTHGNLAPPGSNGAPSISRGSFSDHSRKSVQSEGSGSHTASSDDSSSDEDTPNIQLGCGTNKLKGLFDAMVVDSDKISQCSSTGSIGKSSPVRNAMPALIVSQHESVDSEPEANEPSPSTLPADDKEEEVITQV